MLERAGDRIARSSVARKLHVKAATLRSGAAYRVDAISAREFAIGNAESAVVETQLAIKGLELQWTPYEQHVRQRAISPGKRSGALG